MKKQPTYRVALAPVLAVLLAATAQAVPVFVGETGNTLASAFSVDGLFGLGFDADIFNSTTVAHASVVANNDSQNDVDWYSFTVLSGGSLYLDIDAGWDPTSPTSNVDTALHLFDSAGTLLAWSDDSSPDPGSAAAGFDSFLGVYAPIAVGVYYVAVSNFANFSTEAFTSCDPTVTMTRPDGDISGGEACTASAFGIDTFTNNGLYDDGNYILHISNTQPVPAPATLALLAIGLVGMVRKLRGTRRTG